MLFKIIPCAVELMESQRLKPFSPARGSRGQCWGGGRGSAGGLWGSGPWGTASPTLPPPWREAPPGTERLCCARAVTADSLAAHPQQAGGVLCLGAEVDAGASPLPALPVLRWILPSF